MVDVSTKADSRRVARATGMISMSREAFEAVRDNAIAKGDVLGVARIAGIMGAKHTADMIPLCHPIPLASIEIDLALEESEPGVRATSTVVTTASTGVEMEAMMAVTVALTTIYDMAKSVDRAMVIGGVRLLSKTGGKSGDYTAA
ncbi:MAG: cyclic pyranopterin monophosphate synthase MoaC [Gemmatimonadota bacterium]|nr:cyclic pyranopterin monophosphate synthase MoaC [Gemmatimonadota bacterium]